jgi:NAD(P)-dependent dehydrogenase (short-subunit alcohol dehydrogenase family)
MNQLRGAVAVVTGAASGIGRALSIELGAAGAKLAVADVNTAGLKETCARLEPATVLPYNVDVGDAAGMEEFARKVGQDFGRATLLVNNAGVALYGTVAEVSVADMQWLFRVNFWGVVHGCKAFLPLLLREPEAHIVNMSSIFGLVGPPGQAAYASSKFAVRGFTESLRYELRETKVRVSCVHPAGIQTAIAENARVGEKASAREADSFRERFKKLTPTSAEQAARIIMKGILNNRQRILVGADAYRIDTIQRVAPSRGVDALVSLMEKRAPSADNDVSTGVGASR